MKTILFKTIIIAFFVGTAVSCSDEDENRFRPGSTHEKPNPTEPELSLIHISENLSRTPNIRTLRDNLRRDHNLPSLSDLSPYISQ